jgi:hypothetical protein
MDEMNMPPNIAHYCRDETDPSKFVRDNALSAQVDYTKIFANELKGLNFKERADFLNRVQNQLQAKELSKKLGINGD